MLTLSVFGWIFSSKVGHSDLFLLCFLGSLVGPCMPDYKSLCAAVVICSTQVNIHTDRQTDRQTFDQLMKTKQN